MMRDEEMVAAYEGGMTFAAIGAKYGITRQRVAQIVRRAGCDKVRNMRVPVRCVGCGRGFMVTPFGARRRKYCSRPCSNAHRAGRAKTWIGPETSIHALRTLAEQLGHTPSCSEITAAPEVPSHTLYVRYFGSIRAAQIAAGLTPNRVGTLGHLTVRSASYE